MVDFRKNIKEVLHMFSRELEIMDANTVRYMIDELNAEKEQLEAEVKEQEARVRAVSYTHLDVYKRQPHHLWDR